MLNLLLGVCKEPCGLVSMTAESRVALGSAAGVVGSMTGASFRVWRVTLGEEVGFGVSGIRGTTLPSTCMRIAPVNAKQVLRSSAETNDLKLGNKLVLYWKPN